ncbi:unnamed protein product [Cylindrotheca closterium]|uniref:Uncharacterized protein n=1 Tax=Cylindrotheca closterium TaxID=2856 RepID=A0AAD2G2F9_9STRA|nr:unnamed protein product [Cylindrotheca closterium]
MSKSPPLEFGREYITCDGPDCNVLAPKKRCSQCRTVFYCSVACQKKHWVVEHKTYCMDTNKFKTRMLTLGDGEIPQARGELKEGQDKQDCAICLRHPMVDPYVLPSCGHAFCFSCLAEWQNTVKNNAAAPAYPSLPDESKKPKLNCPACRAETPDVQDSILQKARLLAARANNRKTSESEKITLRREALAELDQLEKKGRPPVEEVVTPVDVQISCQRLATRAELLLSLQEPEKAKEELLWLQDLTKLAATNREEFNSMVKQGEALTAQGKEDEAEEVLQKLDEYKAKRNTLSLLNFSFDVYAMLARAEEMMENWEAAKLMYFAMMENMTDHTTATPPQQREMYMGMCRVAYHLKRYDKALAAGEVVLEMNRHFPFCHKYIALSQKAMGDMDAAKVTMARALVYEAPWDDQHHEQVLELYREIVGEEPEVKSS